MEISAQLLKRRIAAALPASGRSTAEGALRHDRTDRGLVSKMSDLLAIPDNEQFLKEAFRKILDREPDISGFVNYLELLQRHVPRRAILVSLTNSDEAKQRTLARSGSRPPSQAGPYRTRLSFLHTLPARLMATARDLVRRLLFSRFDSIDHKLNFLLRETAARSDAMSTKLDVSLATLSEKIDTYVAALIRDYQLLNSSLQDHSCQVRQAADLIHGGVRDVPAAFAVELQRLNGEMAKLSSELLAWKAARTEAVEQLHGTIIERLNGGRVALEAAQCELSAGKTLLTNEAALIRLELSELRDFMIEARDLRATGARSPVIAAGHEVLVTEVEGLIIAVPRNEWRMAAYHAFRGPMEPGVTTIVRTFVRPGSVFVDVGANIGFYTVLAGRLLSGEGKVHSFEPTPATYRILKDNVQVNGLLETGIVQLHQLAVSDRPGKARLWTFSGDCGHNTLFKDQLADADIEVQSTTLDYFLSSEQRIDLIKIDVEGAEPLVFAGMLNLIRRNPQLHIIVEFAPVHLRRAGFEPNAVLELFRTAQFEIHHIHEQTGELSLLEPDRLTPLSSVNLLLIPNR